MCLLWLSLKQCFLRSVSCDAVSYRFNNLVLVARVAKLLAFSGVVQKADFNENCGNLRVLDDMKVASFSSAVYGSRALDHGVVDVTSKAL